MDLIPAAGCLVTYVAALMLTSTAAAAAAVVVAGLTCTEEGRHGFDGKPFETPSPLAALFGLAIEPHNSPWWVIGPRSGFDEANVPVVQMSHSCPRPYHETPSLWSGSKPRLH